MSENTGLTTHELRSWFGWSQKDFAMQFHIPLGTVQNWDSRKCMPLYIQEMCLEIRKSWDQIIEQDRSIKLLTEGKKH